MDAPKFTAELKAKWIEALRSGKYEQCQDALHDGIGHCCLGVLEIVSGVPSRDKEILASRPVSKYGDEIDEGAYQFLPQPVQVDLARLNDRGSDFSEIADYIEANIPAVEASMDSNSPSIDQAT